MYINEKYKIESDPMNLILYKKKIVNITKDKVATGETKEVWGDPLYFPTYAMALRELLNQEVLGIDDIKDVVKRINEVKKIINRLDFDEIYKRNRFLEDENVKLKALIKQLRKEVESLEHL